MRTLNKVIEFQQEASNALFTKAQALAITMQLLELERRQPENTPEEAAVLENAMKNLNFRYLDTTETQTDQMPVSYTHLVGSSRRIWRRQRPPMPAAVPSWKSRRLQCEAPAYPPKSTALLCR